MLAIPASRTLLALWLSALASPSPPPSSYPLLKAYLDSVPAIDTHDHLPPFDRLPGFVETEWGRGMNLAGLWLNSYFRWIHPLTPWKPGGPFQEWWATARHAFDNGRATSVYRYQAIALQDLYGVDFDNIDDQQALELNRRIFEHYRNPSWLLEVITERANIELMLNDPWWGYLDFQTHYPFEVLVLNVNPLLDGFHPSQFEPEAGPSGSPYEYARVRGWPLETLEDYLQMLEKIFQEVQAAGAACLKTTAANRRSLRFERATREQARRAYGRPRDELTPEEIKAFQDFILWRLVELSARCQLPFQFHTGLGRLEGSNPLLLLNLIEANPETKFILFHGGFPWVGEAGAIVTSTLMRRVSNVWLDSVWLPTLSFHIARRAFQEWLDSIPSDCILWGADCNHAEGIYGATEMTRRVLAEVLAERVDEGSLSLHQARRIGRQILRDNALQLFPSLKNRLWKGWKEAGEGEVPAPGRGEARGGNASRD